MSAARAVEERICDRAGCGAAFMPRRPSVHSRYCSIACSNQARGQYAMAPEGTFGWLMETYRLRTPYSRNALSLAVGVDASYLSRISYGQREPPARAIVDALARVLRLTAIERNRLLTVAGYSVVEDWDETMQEITEVLADTRLSEQERAEFRQVVRLVAARWRPSLNSLIDPCPHRSPPYRQL